jgi:hypothetical protein
MVYYYIYYWNLQFLNNLNINQTNVILPQRAEKQTILTTDYLYRAPEITFFFAFFFAIEFTVLQFTAVVLYNGCKLSKHRKKIPAV